MGLWIVWESYRVVIMGSWGSEEGWRGTRRLGVLWGVIDLGHCRGSGRGYREIMGVFGEV